jgi:glycosyltransferase involved in cell wall biosynthesis
MRENLSSAKRWPDREHSRTLFPTPPCCHFEPPETGSLTTPRSLLLIGSIPAVPLGEDRVVLTAKFVEGMEEYAKHWGGPVRALLPLALEPTDNLDNIEVRPSTLPFALEAIRFATPEGRARVRERIREAGVVFGGPNYELRGLSCWCAAAGVPCVYNTEYSLRTRLQIARAEATGPLRLARHVQWELVHELHILRELRHATSLQCNGTPTYEAYRRRTRNALLYFDTRTRDEEIATDAELERANERRMAGAPLQLAFSGRLIEMKGADDLVRVARALRDRGVDFHLSIFGGGALEERLRREIREHGLEGRVTLEGVLDFHGALLPRLKREVDLFVCCHPQGDPSCTYLETLAAGVPIAGYANEAFAGLLREAAVGWSVPIGAVDRLADEIAHLDRERGELADAAGRALAFARRHAFEATFQRRLGHLREVLESVTR